MSSLGLEKVFLQTSNGNPSSHWGNDSCSFSNMHNVFIWLTLLENGVSIIIITNWVHSSRTLLMFSFIWSFSRLETNAQWREVVKLSLSSFLFGWDPSRNYIKLWNLKGDLSYCDQKNDVCRLSCHFSTQSHFIRHNLSIMHIASP